MYGSVEKINYIETMVDAILSLHLDSEDLLRLIIIRDAVIVA